MTNKETEMKVEVRNIGPAEAATMLERNHANRQIRNHYVTSLARQMRNGFWKLAGDPIRISIEGDLLDGQHRLTAIIESGTTQQFVLVKNVEVSAQTVMDSGVLRTFGDVLKMQGEGQYHLLAGIIRCVHSYEQGASWAEIASGTVRGGNLELLAILQRYPELHDAANIGGRMNHHYKIPGRIAGFSWWLLGRIDQTDRDEFFRRLLEKDWVDVSDPLSRLHTTMLQDAASIRRMPVIAKFALLLKTWNFYRDGATVQNLRWRRGGARPEAFPEPY
jgi:hypothetical protein